MAMTAADREARRKAGEKLMDQLNREDAERAQITTDYYWQKVKQGLEDDDGRIRLGHLQLTGKLLGMEPAAKVQVGLDLGGAFRQLAAVLIQSDDEQDEIEEKTVSPALLPEEGSK